MRAIYIEEFGSVDGLEIRELPDLPPPSAGQVLVRVRAAGLNRADLLQVRGWYPPPSGYSSNIPGLEFAGEIAAVGEGVNRWQIADRVFGITAGEAQAEFLLIDERLIAKIPDQLSFVEAAAVPEAFITAHDALFTLGSLKENESLLIHAVGSGVGLAGLQLAKAKGAFVIGTSRTQDKLDRCLAFGLDKPILTNKAINFASIVKNVTDGEGVNVILELVGAAYFQQDLESLSQSGRLILVGLTSGSKAEFDLGLALRKRSRIVGTVLRPRSIEEKGEAVTKFASEVVPLLRSGNIRPNLDRVFPFTDAIAAYKYLESNESFGKIVLEP